MNPRLKFVKAFYKRPVRDGGIFQSSGGGRVTEILIRPLFSQFFPDLTAIIQPLSGEYAGYREILEKISFPVGYGVETGMLIDIYKKWGIGIMAQTDLDLRIHRNQDITSLGKMAFGILQTFWNRIEKYKHITNLQPESYLLRQIFSSDEKAQRLKEILIEEKERRPMIEVESYKKKKKHGLA